MEQGLALRVRRNPKFTELVEKRTRLGVILTIIMLVIYYAFILVIAYAPSVLATPLFTGWATTIGIPIGILVILSAFVLTAIYVHRANVDFDGLSRQIVEDAK